MPSPVPVKLTPRKALDSFEPSQVGVPVGATMPHDNRNNEVQLPGCNGPILGWGVLTTHQVGAFIYIYIYTCIRTYTMYMYIYIYINATPCYLLLVGAYACFSPDAMTKHGFV